jgi:hypothetical protein
MHVQPPKPTPTSSPRQEARDDHRPSPRDWRRSLVRIMPRAETFANARARELAEWADAVLHEDTFAAWVDAHPNAGAAPAELRR